MIARRFADSSGMSDETEDIVQESLVTFWQLSEEGYPIRDAEALLVKITKNNCVAHYRKRKLRLQPLQDIDFVGGSSASDIVDTDDASKITETLFDSLTSTQRKYLKMRNDDGLSLDEIAAITGSPKASIKTTISVARKQMLELLKRQL